VIRKPRRDPVTPELRQFVLARDGACVRFKLDAGHGCRDTWSIPHAPNRLDLLQLDHVQDGYGRMGRRAKSDPAHLVSLCAAAHLGGWATSHRPELRAYLASVTGDHVHVEPVPGCPDCYQAFG